MPVNLIDGTAANDRNYATGPRDLIHAGRGDDFVVTYSGNDTVFGTFGDDVLYGATACGSSSTTGSVPWC